MSAVIVGAEGGVAAMWSHNHPEHAVDSGADRTTVHGMLTGAETASQTMPVLCHIGNYGQQMSPYGREATICCTGLLACHGLCVWLSTGLFATTAPRNDGHLLRPLQSWVPGMGLSNTSSGDNPVPPRSYAQMKIQCCWQAKLIATGKDKLALARLNARRLISLVRGTTCCF